MTDPNSSCEMPEGSFEITILESLNAGEDNVTTICRGQGINMNSLLSSDADINGTFLQDGFPVADPTNWIPVSLNDQVMVEYIVASTNNSCVSDTAFITVGISDELSAGVPSADNIVCESQTINLTNYIENETPGGQFYLSSDLSTNIEDVISLSEDTEFTYIIPAAPGCDADTSVFSLETTPDSEVMLALSKAEMCFDDEECIEAQISTNVDGLFEILISGGPLMTDINSISIVSSNGVLNLTLCPSINFDTPSMNSDTFFMGAGPVVQIDVNSIEGTPYDCQSKSLDLSQTLTILEDFQLAIDTTLCPGGFITVGGQDYFESTSIMEARSNGCDSIIHIDIDNFPQDSRDLEQDLCLGQVYTEIPGFSFEENIDTTIVLLGASSFGCDSTINLILNFTDKAVGPFDTQLCFGDSIEIDGVVFDADFTTGEVPSPTLSAFGCDSSTMVTVSFFDEVITGDFNTTLCPEDNFPLGDQVYDLSNSSGVSILQGEAVGGCDSMVNVVIDFYPESYDQIIDLCANDTIVIGNELFHAENTSGTISTNLNTVFGCDSVMNVTLNLTSLDSRDFTRALCDDMDFEFNGRTYNFSNPTGTEYIENTIGCDSVYNIEIIQLDTEETFIKIDLCTDQDTTINGILYNATNTMNASSLVAQNGCDSIVTVEVFVEEATVSIDSENLGNNTFQLSVVSDVPISEYNWSPASLLDCTICENPVASISQAELIEVSIVSEDGCIYSSEINLLPEDDQTTIDSTLRLYIPNSISTSDPLNNSFFIMSENELIMDALTIYDRWGNQVFSMVDFPTNDDALGWGENDRQNLEQGVYLYVLEFTDPVSGPQVLHGNITLLR